MDAQILDTFKGEICFPNSVDYKQLLITKEKPGDCEFWSVKKFTLIQNKEIGSKYLIGDYEGDDNFYGCSIKIFIYPDSKALGHAKYVAESKWEDNKLDAHYEITPVGDYFIFGNWFSGDNLDVKECFIAYIERNEKQSLFQVQLTSSLEKEKTDTPPRQSQIPDKDKVEIAQYKTKSASSFSTSFIKLTLAQEKASTLHFLAFMFIKIGHSVQIVQDIPNRESLIVSKAGTTKNIQVIYTSKKAGAWTLPPPAEINPTIYAFCHLLQKDYFPDVYFVSENQVSALARKKAELNINNKLFIEQKNNWSLFLDQ